MCHFEGIFQLQLQCPIITGTPGAASIHPHHSPRARGLLFGSQVTAQKNQWELDKLQTQSEMLKKFAVDEVDSHSKEGAYIVGLSMQGARWDPNAVSIEKSKARNDI